MENLYTVLAKIKQTPGLYIGYPSVTNLYMFLCGYEYSHEQLNIPITPEEEEFKTFQPWLQKHFNIKTTASWAKIILLYTPHEQAAFHTFFELLEQFRTHQIPEKVDQLDALKT